METNKISKFGQYEGYSEPIYESRKRLSRYVTLKDGTRLAADIYLPVHGEKTAGPLPVILHYTPYPRRKYTGRIVDGEPETVTTESIGLLPLTAYGYVLVIAEPRGTGASFGVRQVVNSRQEAKDGAELVEWLAAEPFCNGKVGTVGLSYHGQTQLEILSQRPKHLSAAFIGQTDFNRYDGWVRGGIPRAYGRNPDVIWAEAPDERNRQIEEAAAETVPVDEDPEKLLLRQALREHIKNGLQLTIQKELIYRDSCSDAFGGEIWKNLSASTYLEEINASGVPVYLAGGCFDVFRRDTFIMYQNLTLPKKLAFGPWYHVGKREDPEWQPEILRWFDFWMKGIPNGVMEEPPMHLREACFNFEKKTFCKEGTGFYRSAVSWPVSEGKRTRFYPASGSSLSGSCFDDGILSEALAPPEELVYSAVYGIKSDVETMFTTREDGMGVDQKGLTYSTAPMKADFTLAGHPVAHIALALEPTLSGKAFTDIDVFLTLSDYDPKTGLAFQFSDGHLRASLRETKEAPYDFLGLPWHPCTKNSVKPLVPGVRCDFVIDLMPVSYRIPAGHCLRLTLSHSMDRMYYLGREDYESNPDCESPKVRLFLGGRDTTYLEIPDIYEK
ncbi:CocE/NonD family hydrolase [Hominifimenecus sp. rT4P-3]|uniref:CocE/NonD family hydrolase n=1 Tax=Hominifimenecus sp. rT4P-3 TaxID=3242979 RepID=UPI003DA4B365